MRLFFFLLLLMLIPAPASAQVVVEFAVRVEEEVSPEQLAALPVRILMATNGERIVVRGIWNLPRNSYQLYAPKENAYYHCDLNGTIAVRYNYRPLEDVWLTADSPDTIAGLHCNKAYAIEGSDTFPVYYTDAFGVNFCQIAHVPGFAMRYTKRLQGIKVTYEALKFRYEPVPEAMFSLAGRKIVEDENEIGNNPDWATRIGRKAPKINTKLLDGTPFRTRNFKGKVLVIDFNWYGILPSYHEEIEWFNGYARAYAGNPDIIFLSIARNEGSALQRILPTTAPIFFIAPDGTYEIHSFDINYLPSTVVINREGLISEFIVGHPSGAESRIKRAIDMALSGGLKPAGLD